MSICSHGHTVRTYVIGNRPRAKGRNHGAKNTVKRDKAVVLEPPQRLVAYFRRRPDLESYLFEFSSAREEFSGRSGSSRGGRADERYPDKALARERQPANWITAFLSVSIPSGLHLRSSSPSSISTVKLISEDERSDAVNPVSAEPLHALLASLPSLVPTALSPALT